MKLLITILIACTSLGGQANVLEVSKVVFPEKMIEFKVLDQELSITEAFIELRTEFIACNIACKYETKFKRVPAKLQISGDSLVVQIDRKIKKKFSKLNARLNECGADLILSGEKDSEKYIARVGLYTRHSSVKKNDCSSVEVNEEEGSEDLLSEISSNNLVIDHWIGPIN